MAKPHLPQPKPAEVPPAQPAPAANGEPFYGMQFALWVWGLGFVLLVLQTAFDFLFGFFNRG